MGVLLGRDFILQDLGAGSIGSCRFLAVPSCTLLDSPSVSDFRSKAAEQARRHGRPVLYANHAREGHSSIFVDCGQLEPDPFPSGVGHLAPNEEGVLVADVNLGYRPVGGSERYETSPVARPFAAATLVYRASSHEAAYAAWLKRMARPLLGAEEITHNLRVRFEKVRDLLTEAWESHREGARRVRLELLTTHRLRNLVEVEDLRRCTREVLMPDTALPFPTLCAALARGATKPIAAWLSNPAHHALGRTLGSILSSLHDRSQPLDKNQWTADGKAAIEAVIRAVEGSEATRRIAMRSPASSAAVTAHPSRPSRTPHPYRMIVEDAVTKIGLFRDVHLTAYPGAEVQLILRDVHGELLGAGHDVIKSSAMGSVSEFWRRIKLFVEARDTRLASIEAALARRAAQADWSGALILEDADQISSDDPNGVRQWLRDVLRLFDSFKIFWSFLRSPHRIERLKPLPERLAKSVPCSLHVSAEAWDEHLRLRREAPMDLLGRHRNYMGIEGLVSDAGRHYGFLNLALVNPDKGFDSDQVTELAGQIFSVCDERERAVLVARCLDPCAEAARHLCDGGLLLRESSGSLSHHSRRLHEVWKRLRGEGHGED